MSLYLLKKSFLNSCLFCRNAKNVFEDIERNTLIDISIADNIKKSLFVEKVNIRKEN